MLLFFRHLYALGLLCFPTRRSSDLWFQYPPELGQTVVQPLQVIFVPFPLIVPAVGLHFEVRRIGNNQINGVIRQRSEEHTSELQSRFDLVCRRLLEKKNINANDVSE